jgi:hypothetical protein
MHCNKPENKPTVTTRLRERALTGYNMQIPPNKGLDAAHQAVLASGLYRR